MEIKQQIMDDLKEAMRSGAAEQRDTLRNLRAAIKQVEIDEQQTLDDAGVIDVLGRQAKQRRESIVEYEAGGREDLAAQERRELAIIETYLPRQFSADEIRALARQTIDELGVTDPRGMGQVMGQLMPQLRGQADGRLVNQIVRELLQKQ